MANGRMYIKLIVVTPKELEEIVERKVKQALVDHDAEKPLRARVDSLVEEVVQHQLRTTRMG